MARAGRLPPHRRTRRSFTRIFSLTLVATALAKGAAFLPGYSIDDYTPLVQGPLSLAVLVAQKGEKGRFGSAFLNWLLQLLELSPAHSRVLFVGCSLFASALFAVLVVRFWGLDRNGWLAPAMACMVANHPYTAEIFTFRLAIGIALFPLAVLSLLLVSPRWSPRLLVIGSALFAAALSIYQLAFHFGLMIVSVGAAVWLTRFLVLGSARGWPPRVVSLLSIKKLVRHRNSALLACIALGTLLYVVVASVLALALKVSLVSRTHLLPLQQWGARVREVLGELKIVLLGPSPLIAPLTRWLLLLVLAGAVAGLLWRGRDLRSPRSPLLSLSILLLLLASLVWSLGTLLVLEEFWPASRVMAHMGIFWAGLLAVAYLCLSPRPRATLAALALLITFSFIGSNNRILDEQLRLNRRDAYRANRIVARLETMPGFSGVQFLAVQGVNWNYPVPFATQDHDLNLSAFGATQAKVALMAEVSGYDLQLAEEDAQIAAGAAYCRGQEPWPGARSVAIQGSLAIVCLNPG
jgi:MFS family permease